MTAIISYLEPKLNKGEHLLTQWRAWQQSQGLSERTIAERHDTITRFGNYTEVAPIDAEPSHIIAYCSRQGISPATRATYHAALRAFYAWALKAGHIHADPTAETPRPKRPKGLPRPVHTAHVSAMLAQVNRKRTRAMIILAAYAGLRVHEVAKFRGEDIDQYSGILTVTGKGGKTAMLPAHDTIIELAKHFPTRGYWFPAYNGAPHIRPHAVSKAIRDTMIRAGIEAKPHQLRHWYASTLIDEGVDVRIVKDLMRHESLATTEIYTKVSMRHMTAGIAALPIAA